MRQHNRRKALRNPKADEQQEEGNPGYDIRIHHRYGIREIHHLPRTAPQVEDTDGRDAA